MDKLEHELLKGSDSKNLVVFVHGFPDNLTLWKESLPLCELGQADRLLINLPNFGDDVTPWGQPFEVVVDRLQQTIYPYLKQNNVLVCHDWGCHYSYMLDEKFRGQFQQILALDIGGRMRPTFKETLLIMAYQLYLVIAFLLGSNLMTRALAWTARHRGSWTVSSRMNYPYYYFWKNELKRRLGRAGRLLSARYQPSAPVTYIYGRRKPFFYHSEEWLGLCKEVIAADCGHWIMWDMPGLVITTIHKLLK